MKFFYSFNEALAKLNPIYLTCFIYSFQLIHDSNAQHGAWSKKTDFGGSGRSFAASFSIGNKGYVGTGLNQGGQTQDFWEYDPVMDSWTQKANFWGGPTLLCYGLSIGTNGYFILANWDNNQLWEYNPSTNTWSQKINLVSPISTGACFSINNNGYVVCQLGNCWEYNPATDAWTQKANSDTAFTVGFSIGSKGYAGTGGVNNPNNYFAEYNPSTNMWTTKANFAGGRRHYAVGFSIGNKGYIGTGVTGVSNYNDFWEYDPATDAWTQITDMGNDGITTATAFSIGNRGYVACGQDNTGYSKALWELYPDITINITHTGTICSNQCNGSASATVTLGNPPYSYLWSTIPQQTTATVTGLCPGTYSVTVTDSVTSVVGSVTINPLPGPATVPICMVTVDSNSQNNIIIWDKTPYAGLIDSFFIYREIATNSFQPIGAVPFESLSLFIDTVRTLYFPNSGNPNAGTYRYKIIVSDTCGGFSALSAYHNTIFITNNNGNFFWSQPYTIENSLNQVSAYILMRDDFRTGDWHAVNSVSGTQQGITDPDYGGWQATARWRVETQWNISCTPTMKSPAPYSSSFSNIYQNLALGINEDQKMETISILPNPTNGIFTVHPAERILNIEVFNVWGEKIYSSHINSNTSKLDLSNQSKGIYFIEILQGSERSIKKIILQ